MGLNLAEEVVFLRHFLAHDLLCILTKGDTHAAALLTVVGGYDCLSINWQDSR